MCSTTRRRPETLLPDPVCGSLVPTARAIWIASSALTTLLSPVQTGLSLLRNPEDRLELRRPLDNLAGNSVAKGFESIARRPSARSVRQAQGRNFLGAVQSKRLSTLL